MIDRERKDAYKLISRRHVSAEETKIEEQL
jgi:hypothetical protein